MLRFHLPRNSCWLFLFAVSLLFACSKNSDEPKRPSNPVVYSRGIINGDRMEKTIGAAGGTIVSQDGRLQVTVPPGALANNQIFSITPITNTCPLSSGDAYRLEPENISFLKPVQISLSYSDTDLEGTIPEALYLGFQNQAGHWNMMIKSVLNKTNKTITAESDHFSDWGIVDDFRVRVEKDVIQPDESVQLKAYKSITLRPEDSLLAPLVDPEPFDLKDKVSWRNVSGPGTLTAQGVEATYKAPAAIPAKNPVLIETSITGIPMKNPVTGRVFPNSTLLILTPITIAGGSVVTLSYKGTDYVFTNVVIGAANGQLTVQGVDENWKGIHLIGNSNRAGSFPYGKLNEAGKASAVITVGAFNFSTDYTKCNISGDFYSEGSFVVSKWADAGELVKGSFSGTVYSRNPPGTRCPNEPEKHSFSGIFQGLRQY